MYTEIDVSHIILIQVDIPIHCLTQGSGVYIYLYRSIRYSVGRIDLLARSKMVSFVLKDLQTAAKRAGLSGMETVTGVLITDEEWTSDNVRTPLCFRAAHKICY